MLWDDDGQGYFVATHFADGYKDYIFRIAQDGYHLEDEGVLVHHTDDGLYPYSEKNPEALKMFKKDGLYYFFHNAIVDGKRKVFVMRAAGISGCFVTIPFRKTDTRILIICVMKCPDWRSADVRG